jgi:Cu2+-exporting ATPase
MISTLGIVFMATGASLGHVHKIPPKNRIRALRTKSTSEAVRQATRADAALVPHHRKPYQFAIMSGVMGLSVAAQFSAPALIPVALIGIGYLSATIFEEAASAIFREKRIQVDMLDATVITLCVGFGQIAAAGFMVWVLDIADLLLEKTRDRSERFITDIFGSQPRTAWLLRDGQEIEIAVADLRKGDIIVVNTGEQIPVDGVVVNGSAMIDQHSLTGEAAPVERHEDDKVYAMTVLVAGRIHLMVEETGEETLAYKIVTIINDAANFKVELQSTGERIADKMVVPTLSLGMLGYFTAGAGGMLAIVNADYGTGIRVAAPIALLAALGRAAQHGVLIKDSQVFESLKDIDAVLFDKTGTLTYDVPAVAAIVPASTAHAEERILLYAAAAEQRFSHPIAKAILAEAHRRGLRLPEHDDSKYHVGLGIAVTVGEVLVKVGSARYMEQEMIPLPAGIAEALDSTRARGHSAILIAIDDEMAGLIELQAQVRDEAKRIIGQLRTRGINEIVLISGDHEAPTRELATSLEMDRYYGGVLPHEKADYVKMLQAEGKKVMMVGDGINDSAALSLADIAVSLQGASTIAIDVADVVFMDGNLEKFDYLFQVTDMLHNNVRRSFAMIAIPNSVCILGGLTGVFGLAASLVLNNGFNLISAMNAALAYHEVRERPPMESTTDERG